MKKLLNKAGMVFEKGGYRKKWRRTAKKQKQTLPYWKEELIHKYASEEQKVLKNLQ